MAAEPPAALRAFESARKALNSGRVEWSALPEGDEARALRFVSRYASNGDMIFERHGDSEGWTVRNPDTGEGFSRYPHFYMIDEKAVWSHRDWTMHVNRWEPDGQEGPWDNRIKDVRALGAYVTSNSLEHKTGLASIWGRDDDPVESWDELQHGDLHIVTGHTRGGARITWHVNAERGWNAERIEYDTGYGLWEAVSTLQEYGGAWFPAETRYYQDGKLQEAVVVRSASFNVPDDPQRFSLADIAVEPGTHIVAQNRPNISGPDSATWNGEQIVKLSEWLEDRRTGRRDFGPKFKEWRRLGRSPYSTPEEVAAVKLGNRELTTHAVMRRHAGLWERYVRDFIERYKLLDEQKQRAWAVLLECRNEADAVIDRHRPRLTELISKMLAAKEQGEADKERELTAQIKKLRAPVDDIFEQQLKPRLEKLPTRAQRKAAEDAAASQPAATKP